MDFNQFVAAKLAYQYNSGYWKVNDRCFFNKAECLRYASGIKNFEVSYHFFDEVYNTVDWSKEPLQSLDSMYLDRATQIRDRYNYVALMFSGGCDSTTMLETFLKNNIHIDEIITVYPIEVIEKLKDSFNPLDKDPGNVIFEYVHSVVPMFKYISENFPKIKLTVIDPTKNTLEIIDKDKIHKLFLSGLMVSPYTAGWFSAYDHVHKVDKNSCIVFAIDKPRIVYNKKENKFKSYFADFNTIHGHWPKDTFGASRVGTEYFYYSPDMPLIPVKQCKQIEPGLRKVLDPSHPLHNEIFKDSPDKKIVDVHHNYVKQLIYPNWNINIFQANKPESNFYIEHTNWIYHGSLTDNKLKDFYHGQIIDLVNGVHRSFIEYDSYGRPSKFRDMITKTNTI